MSDDRIDVTGTDTSHHPEDDDHRLEAVIESLNSQIAAFEQKLESAVLAETQFRNNIQTQLNTLDAFVERHVEKDRHLTQLIEEDTQRSKEAKEEYDALASRFDDNLRRDNITRTRDWLRTVTVYVGIVTSVVLMAPLHALWWLFNRTLARMGLLKSSEETTIYSTVRRRRRDLTHKSASSNGSEAAIRHRPPTSTTSGAVFKEGESLVASTAVPKKNDATQEGAKEPDAPRAEYTKKVWDPANRNSSHPIARANPYYNDDDALTNDTRETGSNSGYGKVQQLAESSESDEEFLDARNGSEERYPDKKKTQAPQTEQIGQEEGDNSTTRENAHPRPGWAMPAGSDETLPDLSAFPSSDFWEISDDDVRLEAQRSDMASS